MAHWGLSEENIIYFELYMYINYFNGPITKEILVQILFLSSNARPKFYYMDRCSKKKKIYAHFIRDF